MSTASLFKKIQSRGKKHTTVLIAIVTVTALLLLLLLYTARYQVYFFIGNTAFGGKVLWHTFYTIDTAESYFTKANESLTPIKWNNYQLSRINFIKGDLQRAEYFANKELLHFPDNCRTHYIRGLSYGYMERLDDAIHDFETFNACFPDTWAGHNDLAWFWFRKGDMKKVIEVVEEVIAKDNNATSPWLQNTYGVALMNVGRYFASRNAFLMAKYISDNMTEDDWGKAYPGNDPRIYGDGLSAMRVSIQNNLNTLDEIESKTHSIYRK